jgi:hypothetical protein
VALTALDIQKKIISGAVLLAFGCVYAGPQTSAICISAAHDDALPGRCILKQIEMLAPRDREARLVEQLIDKSVYQRADPLKPISWIAPASGGMSSQTIKLWITPDYLSVGTTKPVRVPLTPQAAQRVADAWGCLLPTTKIVDTIHTLADKKLEPQPFSPAHYNIESISLWQLSDAAIDAQLEKLGTEDGEVVAGIKKDVVLTHRLAEPLQPARVAIYGWHRQDGSPIQPLTLVHRHDYLDYSHGIRLVADKMELDGVTTSVRAVLLDPVYAPLLSSEGAFTSATLRY